MQTKLPLFTLALGLLAAPKLAFPQITLTRQLLLRSLPQTLPIDMPG